MKTLRYPALVSVLFCLSILLMQAQAPVEVWRQFTAELKDGKITAADLRPYDEMLRAPLLGFVTGMRQKADWQEWQAMPEVHRVGDRLHFLIPLTFDGNKTTYCFTFITQNGRWYFQHLESIFIRLDRTGQPPISTFPDVSEDTKDWMREEIAVSQQVKLFALLAKEKGKTFAFDWFRDGPGYFLGARTWVPFVDPSRAFVLYACWEQANLRGNKVTLETLTATQARIRMTLLYLQVYEQSGHVRQQIAYDDYRRMLETIWQDRARAAGWDLKMMCKGTECVFDFSKPAAVQGT